MRHSGILPRSALLSVTLLLWLSACGDHRSEKRVAPEPPVEDGGKAGAEMVTGGELVGPPGVGELGVLPPPAVVSEAVSSSPFALPRPGNPIEQAATRLAAASSVWTTDGLAALEASVLYAGFTIMHGDEVLHAPEEANGLVIQAVDLQLFKLLGDRGQEFPLADLRDFLGMMVPDAGPIELASFIKDAVLSAATSPRLESRRWSAVVQAYARFAPSGHDWAAPPDDVQLAAPEMLLVFTRLIGDLAIRLRDLKVQPTSGRVIKSPPPAPQTERRFCELGSAEQTVLDAAAAVSSLAFRGLFDHLENAYPIADPTSKEITVYGTRPGTAARYKALQGAVTAIGAALKLIVSLSAFEATGGFTDGTRELERTQTRKAGERKTLYVVARLDSQSTQFVNCYRPLLQSMGLDFDLPQGGPVGGSNVSWTLDGNLGRQVVPDARGEDTVAFHRVVQFVGNPTMTKTDGAGRATIDVEGAPQRVDLPRPFPVERTIHVQAHVVLQPPALAQDAADIVSTAAGGVLGLTTFITDFALHTSWLATWRWKFQVIDWTSGFIEVLETGRRVSPPDLVSFRRFERFDVVKASAIINPLTQRFQGSLALELRGDTRLMLESKKHSIVRCNSGEGEERRPVLNSVIDYTRTCGAKIELEEPVSSSANIDGDGRGEYAIALPYGTSSNTLAMPFEAITTTRNFHLDECSPLGPTGILEEPSNPYETVTETRSHAAPEGVQLWLNGFALNPHELYGHQTQRSIVTICGERLDTSIDVQWMIALP